MVEVKSKKVISEDKNALAIANKGTKKEVQSIVKNIRGEKVSSERSILLPNGKKVPVEHLGKKLRIDKSLYFGGKNYKFKAGTKFDDIDFNYRARIDFKPSDFE